MVQQPTGTPAVRIHRTAQAGNFTIIPNDLIRDPRLDPFALGVLARVLANTPDWRATADAMWRDAQRERGGRGEGRTAYRAAFARLESAGYLVRSRRQDTDGTWATVLHFFDVSQTAAEHDTDDRRPADRRPVSGTSVPPGKTHVSAGRTDDRFTDRRSTGRLSKDQEPKTEKNSLRRASVTDLTTLIPDPQERDEFLRWMKDRHGMQHHGLITTLITNGDIHARITDWRNRDDGEPDWTYRPSLTDLRVRQGLALVNKYRAEEGSEPLTRSDIFRRAAGAA